MGLTLEKLSERSGLTPNYIGGIEIGKRDPSLESMLRLAKALRVPPQELLGGLPVLSPHAIEAGKLIEALPREMQDNFLRLLRSISRL